MIFKRRVPAPDLIALCFNRKVLDHTRNALATGAPMFPVETYRIIQEAINEAYEIADREEA